MVKNCFFFMLLLITSYQCFTSYKAQNNNTKPDIIEIRGHFYKYIPYYIKFPKQTNYDSFETRSKYFNVSKYKYDTTANIFQFNIQEDLFSSLILWNKKNGQTIVIKPNTAKHPPIFIELHMGKYYRSGDTIKIDETYRSGLTANVINFDIDFRLTVKEFDLITTHKGVLKMDHSIGPRIESALLQSLINRDKKTPIFFTNIIVKSINEDVKVDPLVFFVRDE